MLATRSAARGDDELRFHLDRVGGPLVAVAAACGGAGASTLTHLIGAAAARDGSLPVLTIDADGRTGGLAVYAGAESERSLLGAAALVAANVAPTGLFATAEDGLRVIAALPRFGESAPVASVERVLADAQAAHALTVVDCGRLDGDAASVALRRATHVLWLLPATVSGVARGRRVLDACDGFIAGREVLCARHDAGDRRAPMRELMALADDRSATLALIPHVAEFDRLPLDDRLEQTSVALQALAGVIAR